MNVILIEICGSMTHNLPQRVRKTGLERATIPETLWLCIKSGESQIRVQGRFASAWMLFSCRTRNREFNSAI